MLLLPGIAAGRASPVDLVTELPAALSANGADVVWDALPDATTQADPGGDQFTIDAGTPKDPAASGDLVQGDQFGFGYPAPARRDLFGPGGALACDATGVACPAYDTTAGPFAKGAIVVGFQLAAPATVQGPELLTVAVHAADDDYPTAVDPRPGSVFPGTNQLWRLDLSAQGAAVRYLQLAGGTFQEFHTDARVLVDGDHGWFFIPQSEYHLAHTVVGWDLEAYWLPSADSPANRQAIDNLGNLTPRRLLVPADVSGRLAQAAPSPSASASPVASPTGAPSTPAPGTTSGGTPVWIWVVVIAFGGGLLVIALRLWSSGAPAPGSPTTTDEHAPPPIILMEKRRVRRQRRIRVEVETEGRMIYSDESRYETITITETVEEEVPVDAPVETEPVAPEPEPPGPVVPAPPVVVAAPEPVAPVTPCVEEFEAWQAAEARCRAATQAAEQAESLARDARAELDALRQEYPPLGFGQADTTVIEMSDGMRMSDLDRALMDWDAANRPQPPRTSDPHEQLRRNKERLDRVRQEYAGFKAREAELIAKVAEAEAAAREAEAAAKAACDLAAEAKAAYERCMGIASGAEEPKPTPPKPEEPKPTPPKPEEPKPKPPEPEEPKPEEPKPEQPKPEQPKPEQPKPTPGSGGQGGEEPASGGCEEGDERREVLGRLDDLEFLPSGASVKVTVTSTHTSVGLEEEGGYPDAVQAAAAWASQRDIDPNTRILSFDLLVETQVRRVTMECARWLRCNGGRWVEVVQHAESVSDETRVLTIQRENLGIKELRQAINTTASRLRTLDGNRSRFESFCR